MTDFFVATVEDAPSIAENWKRLPDYSTNGVDNSVLAALWYILDPSSKAGRLEDVDFIIAQALPEGPWVFQIPNAMKTLLAELPDTDVAAVADRLAQSKAMSYSHISGHEAATGIRTLRRLACEALQNDRHILLRMAL